MGRYKRVVAVALGGGSGDIRGMEVERSEQNYSRITDGLNSKEWERGKSQGKF